MVTLRTLPVHEIVQRTYPRPPPEEKDHVAMAVGRAIDGTLAQFGHELRRGRRPTATAMRSLGESLLDEGLEEAGVEVPSTDREKLLAQLHGVLQAYRRSEILGLARPKTHVLVINELVGVYAQPDYWDGRTRFYEMKSYPAIPPPPDVALQVRLFQLAFPKLEAVLICINRHAVPVETRSAVIPPPTAEETADALRQAYDLGRQFGQEKVLEYMEGPFVHYTLPGVTP
jgi:hypothetical protein